MWKWRTDTVKSENICLPIPGKLLKTISEWPFDRYGVMQPGSIVFFVFAEKVCLDGPQWTKGQDIELWLFHFMVDGERVHLRWYEEVPQPHTRELVPVAFDWTKYWEYTGEVDEV